MIALIVSRGKSFFGGTGGSEGEVGSARFAGPADPPGGGGGSCRLFGSEVGAAVGGVVTPCDGGATIWACGRFGGIGEVGLIEGYIGETGGII